MLDDFVTLYKSDTPRWSSIEELGNALNWTEMVSLTAADYFLNQGISERFINEQIEAVTRVNYAQVRRALDCSFQLNLVMQNVDDLHTTVAICSLLADSGLSVKGGNWQIFEQFVERSGARVFLQTEVSLLTFSQNLHNSRYTVRWLAYNDTRTTVGPS